MNAHHGSGGIGGQLRAWNPRVKVSMTLLPNFTRGDARAADDLVRNNGYAANAICSMDHIVGSFFPAQSSPKLALSGHQGEKARAFSREVEAAWKEFAEDDCAALTLSAKTHVYHNDREGVAMRLSAGRCSFRPPGIPSVAASGHSSGWSARSASATRTIPATAGTAVPVCHLMTAVQRWNMRHGRGYPG
ncbi:phage portal protein [Escherichia coli]